jgi:AcrR family transcriptional regulator
MSSYIAERRQEEKDRRRIEIIDAAETLYRETGWDAVTMDSVAKHARLSRALVYVYFKDKRDLHFGICVRAMELLRQRFEATSARAMSGLDRVEAIGRAYIAFGQEFPHYFDACARLEMHAPGTEASVHEDFTAESSNRVHEVVVAALSAGQQDGTIRSDVGDLQVISRILWGFTHGMIQIAMTKAEPLARRGISVPQLTQQALQLIRSMLAPRTP